LNIEIKPTPGTEAATGRAVALAAAQLWDGPGRVPGQPAPPDQPPPLLSSFQPEALAAAQAAAPALPRGLLLETLWTGWLETAHTLGCAAVICDELLWNQNTLSRVHRAGLRALAYTVNETASAERLIGLGLDGLITDRIDRFDPEGPMSI
jgi:glycerophosphoryl diester phosphodiesterase